MSLRSSTGLCRHEIGSKEENLRTHGRDGRHDVLMVPIKLAIVDENARLAHGLRARSARLDAQWVAPLLHPEETADLVRAHRPQAAFLGQRLDGCFRVQLARSLSADFCPATPALRHCGLLVVLRENLPGHHFPQPIEGDVVPVDPATPTIVTSTVLMALRRSTPAVPVDRLSTEPEQASFGPLEIDRSSYRARLHGRDLPVTTNQLRLLYRLCLAKGEAVSADELAQDTTVTDHTQPRANVASLRTRVFVLRRMLGGKGVQIDTLRGRGYRLVKVEEMSPIQDA